MYIVSLLTDLADTNPFRGTHCSKKEIVPGLYSCEWVVCSLDKERVQGRRAQGQEQGI